MILKAKPAFNYQSVEFEFEVNSNEDWAKFKEWYSRIYAFLQKAAPEDGKKPTKRKQVLDPATESQIGIMEKYGIDIPEGCTRKQASKLIEDSIARAKEEDDVIDDDDDMPF